MENLMNQSSAIGLLAIAAVGLALLPGSVSAQQKSLKEQLTGAWIVITTDQTGADGVKHQVFGPTPKGLMVLDASGQYTQIITHPELPRFKSSSRLEGTPEENRAVVHGTTATFGIWSVDEATKTLVIRINGGLFPNQIGTESKRSVSLSGDELKTSNPVAGAGMRADTVYRRAK
jgi:hypothetical protein